MIRNRRTTRAGLSLLEVLVALTIFLFSLVAIERLVSMAGDRAVDVQLQARAIQLAQSRMARVVMGEVSLQSSQSNQPCDEDPDWQWSMDSQQGSVPNLYNVTIKVSRPGQNESRIEATLSQLVLDPAVRAGPPAAAGSLSSGSGSSGSGSTGSGSSGSGGTSGGP